MHAYLYYMEYIQYILLGILPYTLLICMYVLEDIHIIIILFLSRGVPGVDWRIDSGETRDLSKVYYNTYDPSNSHPGEGLQLY